MHPNISFAVNMVKQVMNKPTEDNIQVVYKICRYLQMTLGKVFYFKKTNKKNIEIVPNADGQGPRWTDNPLPSQLLHLCLLGNQTQVQQLLGRSLANNQVASNIANYCFHLNDAKQIARERRILLHQQFLQNSKLKIY